MVRQLKPWLIGMLLAGTLVIGAGFAAAVLFAPAQGRNDGELSSAQERWASRPLDRYQLTIVEKTSSGVCNLDLEVEGEQVLAVLRNQCNKPTNWTVSRLFDWVAQLEQTMSNCYPSQRDCACVSSPMTRTVYDAQLGYPQTIVYEYRLRANWKDAAYWRNVWWKRTTPDCKYLHGGAMTVKVALTPAP